MKEMYKGKVNSPATLLVETIDSSVTSIKVADGSVFPEGPNVAVIGTDGNAETIKYESINGNILVGCVRGFQGKASVWDKDTIIARNFTEYDLNALQENILELDKKELKDFQEDENHRTVTDSEKEKWNDKVSQAQITGDVNASGSDKVWNVDFLKKQFSEFDKNKVSIENGKNLSSNDFTNDLKNKLENIEDGANKITKVSQLTNDKNFKTETEIQSLINNSTKLKKEVMASLPSTGKDNIIYLLKNKNETNNVYTEYMWISGKWEIIGDTKVDLSGYAKKTEVVNSVNGKKGDMMVDFFVGDDTRNLNYAPKDYLEHGARYKSYTNSQFEFKDCRFVDLERLIAQYYCIVNTQVPWANTSGGLPMQIAYGQGVMAIREAKDENTWGEWKKVSTSNDIKTKLSEMTEDSTHRTVTDSEKEKWNNKVDKVNGKSLSTNDYTDSAKEKVDSIPSNPKYTDTTYSNATISSDGLMSSEDKVKLNKLGSSDLKVETTNSDGITYYKYGRIVIAQVMFSTSQLWSIPNNEKTIPSGFKPSNDCNATLQVISGRNQSLGIVYARFNAYNGKFDIDSMLNNVSEKVYIIGQAVYITD